MEEDEESEGVKEEELVTFSSRVKKRVTNKKKTMAKDSVGKVKAVNDNGRVIVWFGEKEGVWTGTIGEIRLVTDPGQVRCIQSPHRTTPNRSSARLTSPPLPTFPPLAAPPD